jgi:hypothetical protein
MKIEKIDRKEKDSPGFQALIIVLAIVEVGIAALLTYYAVVAQDTKMVGRFLFLALVVLAVIFWAVEKGYLDYERIHAIE